MNNTKLVGLVVVVALLAGAVGGYVVNQLAPEVGGAFAGGVTPTNYFTGSASGGGSNNGYVEPNGNLEVVGPNGFGLGTAAAQEVTSLYTATTSYPSGTSTVTLGPVTANNSATSTTVGGLNGAYSVGDACEVTYSGSPTSTAFGADAFVSSVNGSAATATITLWNGATASTTFTGSTSTPLVLKATCFHTGV
jgi:hypothetical protein